MDVTQCETQLAGRSLSVCLSVSLVVLSCACAWIVSSKQRQSVCAARGAILGQLGKVSLARRQTGNLPSFHPWFGSLEWSPLLSLSLSLLVSFYSPQCPNRPFVLHQSGAHHFTHPSLTPLLRLSLLSFRRGPSATTCLHITLLSWMLLSCLIIHTPSDIPSIIMLHPW